LSGSEIAGAKAPELAVVVLAVGEMPLLPDAIASLGAQGVPLEIVVVHSGLAAAHAPAWRPPGVEQLRFTELLPTGRARNAGIAATRAPWIAFLAGDSQALPGWAAGRLEAHRGGASMVAAAVVNPTPASLVAWAGHIALHHRRWPRVPASEALLYGRSYARELLDRVGGFRSGLAAGEDTELHSRLDAAGERALWVPSVRSTHAYATRLGELLREQRERGERAARAWIALGERRRTEEIARQPIVRARRALAFARHYADSSDRRRVTLASPLVLLASWHFSRGARAALAASTTGTGSDASRAAGAAEGPGGIR
jgi:GT2 family glycosyltransferase